MSLSHIKNRREPTVFGADLNVLIGDTFIDGNLDIQGNINGTSSQGQNTDNTWTGTNDFSVKRPSCVPITGIGMSGVNAVLKNQQLIADSIVNKGQTWSGENSFSQNVIVSGSPVNATDGVPVQYVKDSWTTKSNSYLTANNTWTGTNTFSKLPLCVEPVGATDVATKNYTDTSIANVTQGHSITTIGQTNITSVDWSNSLAVSVQIIGAGGGSTSSVGTGCASSGVAGASGSTASLIVLTKSIGGVSQGLWTITVGAGGKAGSGCGSDGPSGNGGASNLYVTPSVAGLNPSSVNILRANGGGGLNKSCGEAGTSGGGTYSPINPLVILPFASSSGVNGRQCDNAIPQYTGINTYGWGARAGDGKNGATGTPGGYGFVNFLG